jgi:hypothetical protein
MADDDESKKRPERPEHPDGPVEYDTYDSYAKRRSVIEVLMRFLEDNHVKSDADPSRYRPIICEEVARSRSEVDQEYIQSILHDLGLWENHYRTGMNEFRMTRAKLPFSISNGPPPNEQTPQKAPDADSKPGRKGKTPAGG